jgi:hypothetical protein
MMGDIGSSDVLSVMKRRAFDLLGLYPFDENMIEGFHVSESSLCLCLCLCLCLRFWFCLSFLFLYLLLFLSFSFYCSSLRS